MLTYNIAFERLHGTVGAVNFNISAYSGGGRGSKVHPYGDPKDKAGKTGIGNWDFNTKTRRKKSVRGGPIPPGFYIAHKSIQHPRLGRAAYLEQTLTSLLHVDPTSKIGLAVTNRDGFFIHGRGRLGSDGCIVPMEQFRSLMDALEQSGPVALRVVNPGRVAPDANLPAGWAYA